MLTMKILITGGLGLIGYELIAKIRDKCEITVVDLRDPKEYDLEEIEYIQENITSNYLTKISLKGFDGLIHLAAVSRVIYAEQDPFITYKTNISATNKLLTEFFKANPEAWIIYGSSREVYGEPLSFPVNENSPLIPINVYGETKFCAEMLVKNYSQVFNYSGLIFSFSNVYGSLNDYKDRVIPLFISKALKNKTLNLHGTKKIFDFTFIDDTIQGIIKGINILQKQQIRKIEELNLTTGIGTSLEQLATKLIDFSDSKSSYINAEKRSYDVNRFIGDYSQAKTLLGYVPKYNIEDGLKSLIEKTLVAQSYMKEAYEI